MIHGPCALETDHFWTNMYMFVDMEMGQAGASRSPAVQRGNCPFHTLELRGVELREQPQLRRRECRTGPRVDGALHVGEGGGGLAIVMTLMRVIIR